MSLGVARESIYLISDKNTGKNRHMGISDILQIFQNKEQESLPTRCF